MNSVELCSIGLCCQYFERLFWNKSATAWVVGEIRSDLDTLWNCGGSQAFGLRGSPVSVEKFRTWDGFVQSEIYNWPIWLSKSETSNFEHHEIPNINLIEVNATRSHHWYVQVTNQRSIQRHVKPPVWFYKLVPHGRLQHLLVDLYWLAQMVSGKRFLRCEKTIEAFKCTQ